MSAAGPNARIIPLRQGICGACIVVLLVAIPLAGALVAWGGFSLYFHLVGEAPATIKGASK